jgi:hypothetical protein
VFRINEGLGSSYTPANNADLWVDDGWSAVGRTINLPLTYPYYNWLCTASIKVRVYSNWSPVTVNFEVIDPTNWTYIKLNTTTRSYTNVYQPITMSFFPTRKDMVVRLALVDGIGSGILYADDLSVFCNEY